MTNARGMRCPFGNHTVKGEGVLIKDPKIVRFLQRLDPSFRPQQRVCASCKAQVVAIYREKYKRAVEKKRRMLSIRTSDLISSTSSSTTFDVGQLANTESSMSSDNRPCTSAEAKARREAKERQKRRSSQRHCSDSEEWQEAQNSHRKRMQNVRLPEVQPISPTQIVQLNRDVLEWYVQGITGG